MISKKKRFHTYFQRFFFFFFSFITIVTAIFMNILYGQEQALEGKIYPDVYVNSMDFGQKTPNELMTTLETKAGGLARIQFRVIFDGVPIATFSGARLGIRYDSKGTADRMYLIGRSSNYPTRLYQNIAALFRLQKYAFTIYPEYNKSVVEEFVSMVSEKYNKPARNALFTFEQGKVQSFRQEEKGIRIETESFSSEFETKVKATRSNQPIVEIRLNKKILEPEVTLGKANSFGIEELIAEGKSDFSHSMLERVHNIIVASSKFNGVLIPKDQIFSFNEAVGDISVLTGYKPAYIIKNGRTVLGDGGGVCQVSTTLFRAALQAGLPIIERHAHAYRVSYYESDAKPGFDATVFAPSADLRMKNDTAASILIQTEVDTDMNLLYFRLYGKKDGRDITISDPSLFDVSAPPPALNQDDPTLKRGVVKQVDFPAWGGKASFDYTVQKEDGTVTKQTFFSAYKAWQAVFLVGTAD